MALTTLKKALRKNRMSSSLLEIYFLSKFFLKPKGWLKSRFSYSPLDGDGNPIPWLTYSAIHFLDQKIANKQYEIIEYGSGNSTIWFAERAKRIVSIEHDLDFYTRTKPKLETFNQVTYIHKGLKSGYSEEILKYRAVFDIVVIDGRERINCTENCLVALKENGVVIWDNSDREKYQAAYSFLKEKGFRRIDFKGLGAIGHREWQTSVFYRENNCFSI